MDLSVKLETGRALSLPSPDRFSASSRGWEAWAAVSSAPIEAQPLQLSDSEELDVVSANAIDTEDSPPQSRAYEELVEVVTRVVEKLSIDWPAEREHVRSKGKLDECFLPSHAQPQCRGLLFSPDLPPVLMLFSLAYRGIVWCLFTTDSMWKYPNHTIPLY